MAANYKSLKVNEQLLQQTAEGLSQTSLAALGMFALDALAKTMPSAEFQEFVEEALPHIQQMGGQAQPTQTSIPEASTQTETQNTQQG